MTAPPNNEYGNGVSGRTGKIDALKCIIGEPSLVAVDNRHSLFSARSIISGISTSSLIDTVLVASVILPMIQSGLIQWYIDKRARTNIFG